jgi:gluconate:H+ symporter, GntP family
MHPILILLVGMATVIGAIVVLRLHAFLALIGAAILVSLLAPGEPAVRIARVAEAFGRTAGSIGIVIALAAIIGKAMMDSGAADRVVQAFLGLLGEKRGHTAMLSSGFVLAIPVFFDTVFFLLVPLARSLYTRTKRHYLRYLLAIAAGATAAHTLVPPTPGPLVIAGTLGVDIGTMMMMGVIVALPAAIVGLAFGTWLDRRMPIPLRPDASGIPQVESTAIRALPPLWLAALPILLPVLLISANTIVSSFAAEAGTLTWTRVAAYAAIVGNANLALLVSAAIAVGTYYRQLHPTRAQMSAMVEASLMSGGIIILITAAGGAFGAMLQAAEIGPAIQGFFAGNGRVSGLLYLFMAFGVASLIKVAQGSSTVAMITAAGMLAGMLAGAGALPFNTVYIAMAISSGSLVGSWMNDSGFWIFSKMGGLTEVETLKSWTPLLAIVGTMSMLFTVLLAMIFPQL